MKLFAFLNAQACFSLLVIVYRGINSMVDIYSHKARIFFLTNPQLYKWIACAMYTVQASRQCSKHLPARYEVQSPCITHTKPLSVALCSPNVGKYVGAQLVSTCGFNFSSWRFRHQSWRCIICHLIMTHHWKTPLIFLKVKNSKAICVIVLHLKSNPNGGCKREMRREMRWQCTELCSLVRKSVIYC